MARFKKYAVVRCARVAELFDMLRYDEAFPARESDGQVLHNAAYDCCGAEVMIATYAERKGDNPFTIGRWESFTMRIVLVGDDATYQHKPQELRGALNERAH